VQAGVPAAADRRARRGRAQFDSEALWRAWPRDWAGRRVLVVRGEDGRDWLAEQLARRGAQVDFVAAYRRVAPRADERPRPAGGRAGGDRQRHLWHFSSSEAVSHLRALAPGADWSAARALATHPRIAGGRARPALARWRCRRHPQAVAAPGCCLQAVARR
jgi:uroporphyrinogen-III synthase